MMINKKNSADVIPFSDLNQEEINSEVLVKNGSEYIKETDTFDTFLESSWYFAKFASHKSSEKFLMKKLIIGYQ